MRHRTKENEPSLLCSHSFWISVISNSFQTLNYCLSQWFFTYFDGKGSPIAHCFIWAITPLPDIIFYRCFLVTLLALSFCFYKRPLFWLYSTKMALLLTSHFYEQANKMVHIIARLGRAILYKHHIFVGRAQEAWKFVTKDLENEGTLP